MSDSCGTQTGHLTGQIQRLAVVQLTHISYDTGETSDHAGRTRYSAFSTSRSTSRNSSPTARTLARLSIFSVAATGGARRIRGGARSRSKRIQRR